MDKVLLVDIDRVGPCLPLMKISEYHKLKGDEVGFNIKDPDIVYGSTRFTKNKHAGQMLKFEYPNATINLGGTGIFLHKDLPEEIEKIRPDYSLYPKVDYSMGHSTRGCFRKCRFCVVWEKEGTIVHKHQHPSEFCNPEFSKIMFFDNNFYVLKDWFFEVTDWVLEKKLKIDVTQGMDIRILDEEIACRLKELEWFRPLKFAFDPIETEKDIVCGIEILRNTDIDLRQKVFFYVLVGFDSSEQDDKYRCRLLKSLGTGAYVMRYSKNEWVNKLARWANWKSIYWSIDIDEYHR